MLQIIDGETYVNGIKMEIETIPVRKKTPCTPCAWSNRCPSQVRWTK